MKGNNNKSILLDIRCRIIVAVIAVCALVGTAQAQSVSSDPIIGVWKLNLERSVFMPGPRPPADLVRVYQFAVIEDGFIRFTLIQNTSPQGIPNFQMTVFKKDQQQRPVFTHQTLGSFLATGQQTNLTRSYRRIDARTTEYITYNNGNPGIPSVRTVAPDGQTYTDVTQGTNQQGMQISNVLVYDRVR